MICSQEWSRKRTATVRSKDVEAEGAVEGNKRSRNTEKYANCSKEYYCIDDLHVYFFKLCLTLLRQSFPQIKNLITI